MKILSNKTLMKDVYEQGNMASLKNPKGFLAILHEIGPKILSMALLSSSKVLSRVRMLHNFGIFILRMYSHHGETYTVKYLKACQIAVQKCLAGQPFRSLREIEPDLPLPRLSRTGLPVIIPHNDRRSIIQLNSPAIIRMWLTIFSIYRIIQIEGKFKLATITDEFAGDLEQSKIILS